MRSVRLFIATALCAVGSLARAAADDAIVGVWQLVSYVRVSPDSNETTYPLGRAPTGHIVYTSSGFVAVVVTGEGRAPVAAADEKRDEKQSRLLSTMIAYSGTYRVEGATVTHHVDVAWLPGQVGTDQKRNFKIEGSTLSLYAPIKNPLDGKEYIYSLVWKRVA